MVWGLDNEENVAVVVDDDEGEKHTQERGKNELTKKKKKEKIGKRGTQNCAKRKKSFLFDSFLCSLGPVFFRVSSGENERDEEREREGKKREIARAQFSAPLPSSLR